MRKLPAKSPAPAFDHVKSAEARRNKKAAKEQAGLELNWTRKRAILAKCGECGNFQRGEIQGCLVTDCPLYPFRTRRPVTATEMKEWEERYRNSPDGQAFLKEDAVEEAGEVLDLPDEGAW